MWLRSLFYSIALLIHNLRYQDYGGGWSVVVWWDKKWLLRSVSLVSLGQEGLVSRGRNESPRRDVVFVPRFSALVLYLDGNASWCVETEQGCVSFSTSPAKTCNTGICLSTGVLHSMCSFADFWVISETLASWQFSERVFRGKILPLQNNTVLFIFLAYPWQRGGHLFPWRDIHRGQLGTSAPAAR